jgi:NAD(P)-dependent dehydrogenase (short-subunit alcohol dehydrogenase family)
MDIKGKTALVTGGGVRVGKAITLALAGAGANVVINYSRSAKEAEETAAEAAALGVGALAVKANIGDPEQVARMVAQANERFGGVDLLVNSASLWAQSPMPSKDVSMWRRVISVALDGAFYCSNAVAPHMLAKGEGAIVNIVDLSAWEPWPNYGAHSVAKAGLMALTRQLALELAPAVRVNAIAPGPVLPPLDYSPAKVVRTAQKTLLGRWGKPDDIAQAVLFLFQADYIDGDCLIVDGGERFGRNRNAIE